MQAEIIPKAVRSMSKYSAPCKGCQYREIGCHIECDKYYIFKVLRDIANERRLENTKLWEPSKTLLRNFRRKVRWR